MLELETKISETRHKTDSLRRELTREALSEYTETLRAGGGTLAANVETAALRARAVLKDKLFSPVWLTVISGEKVIEERFSGRVALAFESVTLPIQIPVPAASDGPKVFALASWACVGAFLGILGMMILKPLARLGLDMRDLGLVVGGPLGAFLFVLVYGRLAQMPFVRSMVARLMGSPRRALSYDFKSHERVVRNVIDQWLHGAIAMLVVVCSDRALLSQGDNATEKVLGRLSGKIYALHHTPEKGLSVVADELILEARNCGFEGLDGTPSFMGDRSETREEISWRDALASQYRTFGHVEEGDTVWVERKPVVLEGKVIDLGLVRKVRKET